MRGWSPPTEDKMKRRHVAKRRDRVAHRLRGQAHESVLDSDVDSRGCNHVRCFPVHSRRRFGTEFKVEDLERVLPGTGAVPLMIPPASGTPV